MALSVHLMGGFEMFDEFLLQGIVARLFHSQELIDGGLVLLFEKLTQFGVFCLDSLSDEVVDPISYYQTHPFEDSYSLSLDSHSILMVVIQTHNTLHFRAGLDYIQNDKNEDLIKALSQLIDKLFLSFSFSFAHIDLEGDLPPRYLEDIENLNIQWLFWTNYFGKAYVEKYGKRFLLKVPGWSCTEMSNRTIKCLICSDPRLRPTTNVASEIQAYFSPESTVEIYSWEQFGFM